jgi:hypothetical protein
MCIRAVHVSAPFYISLIAAKQKHDKARKEIKVISNRPWKSTGLWKYEGSKIV